MRRALTWLVTIPISLAGVEFGHAVINTISGSPIGPDGELFQSGGPGAGLGPLVAAIAVGMVLLGLTARIAGFGGCSSGLPLSPLPYACVAPVAFIVQEHIEAILHTGRFSLSTVHDPTFLRGLALQVPFALVAYLIARLLLRVADVVHSRIARTRPFLPTRLRAVVRFGIHTVAPLRLRRSTACSGRAPPGGLTAAS